MLTLRSHFDVDKRDYYVPPHVRHKVVDDLGGLQSY